MKHNLRLLMLTLLCAVFGQAFGQDVTLDFTDGSWNFPTSKVVDATSYTNSDDYTVIVEGTTGNGFRVYSNPDYFLFGRNGASITLPAFDFDVEKIVVGKGSGSASTAVKMNIFVGSNAVSTETTGCREDNTYQIAANYQKAGNVYKLKVTSDHNAQLTFIKIYKKTTSGPVDPSVTLAKTEIKVGEETAIDFPSGLSSLAFKSNKEGVATVSDNGVITGVGAGEATITMTWGGNATYNEGNATFTVKVSKYDATVTLSKTNIMEGTTATISYPDDLTSILFESDDEDVATVSEDGVITGVGAGEATITALWGDNKYKDGEATFTVTVTDPSSSKAFVKVTNLNQVVAGNKYILVTEGGMAMGAQDGNFRKEVEVNLADGIAYVTDDVAVLTLGGKAGAWTFSPSDTDGELSFASDDNNNLVTKTDATDAEKLWRISNDFQVWHRAFPARTIQDNTDATHFGCFRNTQVPSYLYVQQGSDIDENYKKDPLLSITNAFLELGSGPKKPKVNTPSNGTITYSGFDSNIVTFTDGNMQAVDEGTTTVTATLEATAEYEGDVTTFTIIVVPKHSNMTSHLYKKVTSNADLTAGKYLIVYEDGSVAFNGGLTTLDAAGNVIGVTISDDKIFCEEDAYFLIDPKAGTIRSASGYYIGITGNSNGLKTSKDADTYTNDISIDDDEDAVIKIGTMTLRFNKDSGQNRFRYFKSGQQAIQLYKAVDPFSFEILEDATDGTDHYATISALGSEKYYQVSGGAEVFTLTVDNNKLVFSTPFTDGDVIPSNGAYLVRGVPGDYEFTAAPDPENPVDISENMLFSTGNGDSGITAEEMDAAHTDPGYKFYKLAYHPITRMVGFFWGKENGDPFNCRKGHQAYLAVPPSENAGNASAFFFDGTTAISEVVSESSTDNTTYTLSGIRVDSKNLPKGIYIVNGNKVVIK